MSNTVPPEELNRRRRILQIDEELNGHFAKIAAFMQELQNDLGIDPSAIKQELLDRINAVQIRDDGSAVYEPPVGGHGNAPPMHALLARLFATAPKLTNPDGSVDPTQEPAVQCMVLLRGQPQALMGALSRTVEGCLRLMSPATVNGKPVLAEQFFEVEDVQSIMFERDVKATRSSIITGAS